MNEAAKKTWLDDLGFDYKNITSDTKWFVVFIILGLVFHLIVFFKYLSRKKDIQFDDATFSKEEVDALRNKIKLQEQNKDEYLGLNRSEKEINSRVEKIVQEKISRQSSGLGKQKRELFIKEAGDFLATPLGFIVALVLNLPMFLLLLILSNAYASFIANRFLMMILVIIGVTIIVFTLLYMSPSDPAINILGQQATQAEIQGFRELHGLNQPYLVQLWNAIKSVFTFNFGTTYQGGVPVAQDLISRFPVTLTITFFSLLLSLIVALPAGIYAGVKPNSKFDYIFMLFALIGISVPSFWIGLIFILTFSIEIGILPATFSPTDMTSLIMPVVVLGIGLMASVARMARSSTLDAINEDYVMTAKSKGISPFKVITRHVVPNALIPVITIIGLQFSAMLAGSAVTEKVFTVPGIGSYIVDKQFLPDVPAVLAGVVYIAIILSIVNLLIDIAYSFLDPRIRTKIKNGQIK